MLKRIKFALQGRSSKWHKVRKLWIKEHGFCASCKADSHLEVHHIKPFHLHPDLELEPTNLITLCRHCHLVLGHLRDFELYNKDIQNDAKAFYDKMMVASLEKALKESLKK